MAKMKIGILLSGQGTTLQAIIDACEDKNYPAEIALVISNEQDAYGIKRAQKAGIPYHIVSHKDYETREDFEKVLDAKFKEAGVRIICLTGFMRILSDWFIGRWRNMVISSHPSLLPAFKGLHTHERVIESGVRFTGCTVHFVRTEMAEGPIILQAAVPVAADSDTISLAERVLEAQHKTYVMAIRLVAENRVRVTGNTVKIDGASTPKEEYINPVYIPLPPKG